MLIRIQSLWLLLATAAAAATLYFPLFKGTRADGTEGLLMVGNNFPLLLLVILTALLPAITIFLFKKRKKQRWLILLTIILQVLALALMLLGANDFKGANEFKSSTYFIGSIMPVVSIVFLLLANGGVRADEKLIKEASRLR